MSSKVTINEVAETLKRHALAPALLREIIEELNASTETEGDEEPTPRVKQQYVIVSTGPDIGWVIQIEESASPASVIDRIKSRLNELTEDAASDRIE